MKNIFLFLCFAALTSVVTAQRTPDPLSEGDMFPNAKFRTIDRKALKTEELNGKVVMYNFYFAQCPPCIAEMEGLNELYHIFGANDSVVFISVTFDDYATIDRYKKTYGLPFHIVSLDRNMLKRFVAGYPTNYLVDADGKIVMKRRGGVIDPTIATKKVLHDFSPAIRKELQRARAKE